MSILKRYNGSSWETIGMGISQDASEISGVNIIETADPAYPSGKSGDVRLNAGDIDFSISAAYPSATIGTRLQQTISTATPLIADYNTSYYDINNAITNNRIVYVEIDNLRYYFMSKGITSGIGWIKFVANTGSDINIITYNSNGSKTIDNRNSSSIYWATYGVTTAQDIITANQGGQLCLVEYDSKIYTMYWYSDTSVRFRCSYAGEQKLTIYEITCQNTTWDNSYKNVPQLSAIYPIGSIYMSTESTSPASLFGGTWTRITGKFLLGATDASNGGVAPSNSPIQKNASVQAGGYGGEATHTLTENEIPAHNHNTYYQLIAGSGTARKALAGANSGNGTTEQNAGTTETGGGAAHNNMPPFLAVYMWRRTA